MKIRDQAAYDAWVANNTDGYGAAIIRYAVRWAEMMEDDGRPIPEIAKRTSHEADVEGITGFMYGAAVTVLASCWEHGEALRLWHNIDTQLRDEGVRANKTGTVLNPAVMTISA